jgi:hypothetical protein
MTRAPQEVITLTPLKYSRPDVFGSVVAQPHGIGWIVVCRTSDFDTFYWNSMLGEWSRGPVSNWHIMQEVAAVDILQSRDSMLERAVQLLSYRMRGW